ncbi:MAG TPA: hypothetical protein VFI90_05815 [Rubrobacter sp.]|nr:hypothetical protein [Rubrobacter sp.]
MREDEDLVRWHLLKAHSLKGEHQLAEYVANLDLAECAQILATSPRTLPFLASNRDECRVGPGERRSFEEVIRTWTISVLSGVEAG